MERICSLLHLFFSNWHVPNKILIIFIVFASQLDYYKPITNNHKLPKDSFTSNRHIESKHGQINTQMTNGLVLFTIFSDEHWLVMVSLFNIEDHVFHPSWNHKKPKHSCLQENERDTVVYTNRTIIRKCHGLNSYSFSNWNTVLLSSSAHKPPDWAITTLTAARVIAKATGMDAVLCIECGIVINPDKVNAIF